MNPLSLQRMKIYFTALIAIAELAHLCYQHFHGGIISHHFLHRADMPAVSNAWGALLLPALTWFLFSRVQKRVETPHAKLPNAGRNAVIGFGISLLVGIALSVSFSLNFETLTPIIFQALLVSAVVLPVYRAECVLGFVLGMAFVFGAILPSVIAGIIAAVSALLHAYVWPNVWRLIQFIRR